MLIFKRLLRWALLLAFSGLLLAVIAVGVAYWLIAPRLPSVADLKDYHMQVPLRVLSADGRPLFDSLLCLPVIEGPVFSPVH